ncbi:tetratricopeptide repeat protein [Persicimonas caeni]|uniref:Tetratricopeptide repeat protein n=1 Tax=Persicimonas caeni TaxID=2292766 RepID=A0A4Y6PYI9_PERCE|nr:tetratricopeptide repeat protein [Persicimonas caeni]QDG53392.1 tetratricopeptide repeat protein [Persicimonas caeni]QED34613.1 tetratricopeptide repeat protein [Persicimonas caeni]
MSTIEDVTKNEVEASASSARVELKRAFLHMSFAQYDEAIAACDRAAACAPEHSLPVALKGSFEMAAGRVRDALGTLRRATKRHPGDALSHIYFAEACFLAGRERQAERALSRAEKLAEACADIGQQGVGQQDVDLVGLIENLRQTWRDIGSSQVPPPLVAAFEEHSDE